MPATHGRDGVGHAPAVAVEHGQGVQVDVVFNHPDVPPEGGGVEPTVAMCQLHPFGPGGRARGVVDRAGGVLVGRPASRSAVLAYRRVEEPGVIHAVEPDAVGHRDPGHHIVEVGVVEQDRGPGVLDDVGDLLGHQPEVDRHQDPAEAADPVESGQESPRVGTDDGHPLPHPDPEVVKPDGQGPGPVVQFGVGGPAQRTGAVRLVDHGHPVPVDQGGPLQEVAHGQRYSHVPLPNGAAVRCRRSRSFQTPARGRSPRTARVIRRLRAVVASAVTNRSRPAGTWPRSRSGSNGPGSDRLTRVRAGPQIGVGPRSVSSLSPVAGAGRPASWAPGDDRRVVPPPAPDGGPALRRRLRPGWAAQRCRRRGTRTLASGHRVVPRRPWPDLECPRRPHLSPVRVVLLLAAGPLGR